MRFRTIATCAAAFTIAVGAWGVGTASAVEVYGSQPGQGPYVGIAFDHEETVRLANSAVPSWIEWVIPSSYRYADLARDSQLVAQDGRIYATANEIIAEAAARPGGTIVITVSDPAYFPGNVLEIHQRW